MNITTIITRLIVIAGVSWLLLGSTSLLAKDFKDSSLTQIVYPDWFSNDPFLELNEDLATARAAGKQGLMVVYSTEGCSYCGLFIKKSLGDPEIASMIKQHFGSVGLEIFDDAEMTRPDGTATRVKHFAVEEGAAIAPSLLFYGPDGKQFLKLVGYKSPEHFENIISFIEYTDFHLISWRSFEAS